VQQRLDKIRQLDAEKRGIPFKQRPSLRSRRTKLQGSPQVKVIKQTKKQKNKKKQKKQKKQKNKNKSKNI
jgi:hypothetical protein